MAKDFSNLKNQPKKKVEAEAKKADEDTTAPATADADENADANADKDTPEVSKEEAKAKAKAEKEEAKATKADAEETRGFPIYFINRKNKNLSTRAGDFMEGLLVVHSEADAEIVRGTEDYKRGFVDEKSQSEYDEMRSAKK
jgi:CTP:molybdopterin cytidylyltransferase MocA